VPFWYLRTAVSDSVLDICCDHFGLGRLKTCHKIFVYFTDGEKVSDYEMKLMDLDTEHLGIPVCPFVILSKYC